MGVFNRLRSSSLSSRSGYPYQSQAEIGGADVDVDRGNGQFPQPRQHRWSRLGRPQTVVKRPTLPEENKDTPAEMIPVLTLLAAHNARIYNEGYFMLLADLNNEGNPVGDRHWVEVFGTLAGTVLTAWDAASLDRGEHEVTSYLNITDATFKSIQVLQSPQGNLENIIVLSTTMRNRYLLQFGSSKLFDEWTAAMRLAVFESQVLQEAYTGALLSSKGTRLHGIRALLQETKHEKEEECSVRFGAGMPWLSVRALIVPAHVLKKKHDRKAGYGRVEFWDTPRGKPLRKGRCLATVHRASAVYAVFPERAVLMNVSSLIKVEGEVAFEDEVTGQEGSGTRDSTVFIMANPRPGIQGFEMLIRAIIPMMDVFQLYGRPRRLNADKNDIHSMLFAMPTLPKAYYLDTVDVYMLTTIEGSDNWSQREWLRNLKELLARKMSTGYRGTGDIHQIAASTSSQTGSVRSSRQSSVLNLPQTAGKQRAVSEPQGMNVDFGSSRSSPSLGRTSTPDSPAPIQQQYAPSPLREGSAMNSGRGPGLDSGPGPQAQRQAPPPPSGPPAALNVPESLQPQGRSQPPQFQPMKSGTQPLSQPSSQPSYQASSQPLSQPQFSQPQSTTPKQPVGPRPLVPSSQAHERSLSEGGDRNNLLTASGPGLLTPDMRPNSKFSSDDEVDDHDSFVSAHSGSISGSASGTHPPLDDEMFDPAYRPSHLSYAEYSEYMRSYLDRRSKVPPGVDRLHLDGHEEDSAGERESIAKLPDTLIPDIHESPESPPRETKLDAPIGTPGIAVERRDQRHPSGPRDMVQDKRQVSGQSIRSVGETDDVSTGNDYTLPTLKSVPQGSPKMQASQEFGAPSAPFGQPPRTATPPPAPPFLGGPNVPYGSPNRPYSPANNVTSDAASIASSHYGQGVSSPYMTGPSGPSGPGEIPRKPVQPYGVPAPQRRPVPGNGAGPLPGLGFGPGPRPGPAAGPGPAYTMGNPLPGVPNPVYSGGMAPQRSNPALHMQGKYQGPYQQNPYQKSYPAPQQGYQNSYPQQRGPPGTLQGPPPGFAAGPHLQGISQGPLVPGPPQPAPFQVPVAPRSPYQGNNRPQSPYQPGGFMAESGLHHGYQMPKPGDLQPQPASQPTGSAKTGPVLRPIQQGRPGRPQADLRGASGPYPAFPK